MQNSNLKILSIDTSCDETAAAVTSGTIVLSNVIWSQASLHAKFGGVMPSLAQRMHEERIDWVIKKAVQDSRLKIQDIGAVAVTAGPGLAIALGVGIGRARKLAGSLSIPLIPVNHIEGHVLSPLAQPIDLRFKIQDSKVAFPALGLVVSGGHTELILIKKIGEYEILAETADDALGEALDKAARMMGLGYPGGAILEKMAKEGDPKAYPLPLPMARSTDKHVFSYSGLKTAFFRLVDSLSLSLSRKQIYDLAAGFQNRAFQHLIKIVEREMEEHPVKDLLIGGGVAANMELRKQLRKVGRERQMSIRLPYSKKLCGDNAAMMGIAAGFRINDLRFKNDETVDRRPRWKIDES